MKTNQHNDDTTTLTTNLPKKKLLNIVSYNRHFLDKHSTQSITMLLNAQRTVNLSPTTIPTLFAKGNGIVVEDSSQFQQIINERKCKCSLFFYKLILKYRLPFDFFQSNIKNCM